MHGSTVVNGVGRPFCGDGHPGVTQDDVVDLIQKAGIKTVQLAFVDMQGVVRGKFVPADYFLKQMHHGANFCGVALAWDIGCAIVEDISYSNWANGFGDMVARPDLSTFRVIPWQPSSAIVLCDLYYEAGAALEFSPRRILQRVAARFADAGYRPLMASELEFYMLDPSNLEPVYQGIQCYSVFKGDQCEAVMSDVRQCMKTLGIEVEASNTEYGPGQTEVNIRYSDALDAADKTVLFKHGTKEIVRKHDLVASFMPKLWTDKSGSGYHVHQSLRDSSDRGVFEGSNGEMSETMRHYVGGLLRYARELYVLGAWSINAYKRVMAYSYSPTYVNWGYDNRTTAVRAIVEGQATRIETRAAAAEANPYLLFAANLAAGLEGIRQRLEPSEAIMGDGYLPGSGDPLPRSLMEATDLFAGSDIAREYFGSDFVAGFTAICRHETAAFHKDVVHQWERDRYLEMV
ncbi:MAG: glutamine synthetase family protein [Actinobacteria bacterium]|nr:glutamine synthetase family protein [Actinomycetota bacterium]